MSLFSASYAVTTRIFFVADGEHHIQNAPAIRLVEYITGLDVTALHATSLPDTPSFFPIDMRIEVNLERMVQAGPDQSLICPCSLQRIFDVNYLVVEPLIVRLSFAKTMSGVSPCQESLQVGVSGCVQPD